jgi:hypothetical protein
METEQIIMIVFLLLLVSLVIYKVLGKKNECPSCPPCFWKSDEINTSIDIIKTLIGSANIFNLSIDDLKQLVYDLTKKVSFQYFVSINYDERYNLVFGDKGEWSNTLKRVMIQNLIKTETGECGLCIIGNLENTLSPKDLINLKSKDLVTLLETTRMNCKKECR